VDCVVLVRMRPLRRLPFCEGDEIDDFRFNDQSFNFTNNVSFDNVVFERRADFGGSLTPGQS